MKDSTVVVKFGGASVAKPEMFDHVAALIEEQKQHHARIAVVISAMGETTDALTSLAYRVHPAPPRREFDMLVSVGERISISLLAMALEGRNLEAVSFTGSQSGIITCANHSVAQIVDVKPDRISRCLDAGKIAIVAGFQGVSEEKEITTLGRGGSDTTAVALALALGAEKVVFYKDVAGIYSADPKRDPNAIFHEYLTHDAVREVVEREDSAVLHPRCIALAKRNSLPLHVLSFSASGEKGTWIGPECRPAVARPLYEETRA